MTPIAYIHTPFGSKFGVPRQAGLVNYLSEITFYPPFRHREAVRGLAEFEYIWLLWLFDRNEDNKWSPTVRPPRLGGNRRIGVFASRSPFRPNGIGLSSVRLVRVEEEAVGGPILYVEGADLVDGTAIIDIKPYIPYTDSHPDVRAGYASESPATVLDVAFREGMHNPLSSEQQQVIKRVLAMDVRPHYHDDPNRVYAMPFEEWDVKFRVDGKKLVVEEFSIR